MQKKKKLSGKPFQKFHNMTTNQGLITFNILKSKEGIRFIICNSAVKRQ